jgi:hypothetical protein
VRCFSENGDRPCVYRIDDFPSHRGSATTAASTMFQENDHYDGRRFGRRISRKPSMVTVLEAFHVLTQVPANDLSNLSGSGLARQPTAPRRRLDGGSNSLVVDGAYQTPMNG